MDAIELIRNANSAPEILSTLSVYVESLRSVPVIPESCLRLPVEGAADVSQRMLALVSVVNLTSQNLRHQDCSSAKYAMRVFAAATWQLRRARRTPTS